MRWAAAAALVSLAALGGSPAVAKEQVVTVDARSGPWLVKANDDMPYGAGDALPPTLVTGFPSDLDEKLAIIAEGTTRVASGETVGAEGIADSAVDDGDGPKGERYPSFYTPKLLYPANRHALVGAFLDAEGGLIGRPFVIGPGVRVPIASGAAALALGFNDESFAGNSGALTVTVIGPDD